MQCLIICLVCFMTVYISSAQSVIIRLNDAVKGLEKDPQLKHAIMSLYVVNSKTGKPVFDKISETGLVPASCQKVFTSVAAFELLGKDYRFKTDLAYEGKIENGLLKGNLFFI